MKKMLLTGAMLSVGLTTALAQSVEQGFTLPKEADLQKAIALSVSKSEKVYPNERETKKEVLRLSELPEAVRNAFMRGNFSDFGVVAIYAQPSNWGHRKSTYTFELVKADTPTYREGKEHGYFISIEEARTSSRQADLLLFFNEKGTLLKVEDLPNQHG